MYVCQWMNGCMNVWLRLKVCAWMCVCIFKVWMHVHDSMNVCRIEYVCDCMNVSMNVCMWGLNKWMLVDVCIYLYAYISVNTSQSMCIHYKISVYEATLTLTINLNLNPIYLWISSSRLLAKERLDMHSRCCGVSMEGEGG